MILLLIWTLMSISRYTYKNEKKQAQLFLLFFSFGGNIDGTTDAWIVYEKNIKTEIKWESKWYGFVDLLIFYRCTKDSALRFYKSSIFCHNFPQLIVFKSCGKSDQ